MKITRVYADEHGQGHFGDFEIALGDGGPIGHPSEEIPARAVIFRKNDPGYGYDWHTASRRQFIVPLDGAIETETSDGSRRMFRSGEVLLMEDTPGRGHRTRNAEARERSSVFVLLGERRGPDPKPVE